jgi:DNA-binding CsgD family transcriptional regulator
MGERERHRCRERIEAMTHADLDGEQARRSAIDELRRAVGFVRWCWPVTDPETGLAMSGIGEFDFAPSLARLVALEEYGDVASKPQLIVGARASLALSAATGGDLARSRRWRECLHPYGIGDEVMTACRDRHGCWASVELMRDGDDRPFDEDEVRLLDALASTLGALVRRSLVRVRNLAGAETDVRPPATIILDDKLSGRERQVVALVRGGLATKPLARALGISPYTVQDHLKAIFDKTGVRSRRELVSHIVGR